MGMPLFSEGGISGCRRSQDDKLAARRPSQAGSLTSNTRSMHDRKNFHRRIYPFDLLRRQGTQANRS